MNTTRCTRWIPGAAMLAFALMTNLPTGTATAASRYAPLLASTAGQDTLRDLALWEDQRVTHEGRLFEYLTNGGPLVRRRALEAIGRIQDPADAARVIPFLAERNADVAREAAFALGQLANPEAVAPLLAARAGRSPADQAVIVEALGKIGGDEAVVALSDMLRDFNAVVRGAAALALARTKHETAAGALLLAVHDLDASVIWRVLYAMERQDALPRSCQMVTEKLEHPDPLVRAFAARGLGKLSCTQSAKQLTVLLRDSDVRVVVNAARALGELKAKDAATALGTVLTSHESPHARAAAAEAIEKFAGDKSARDALMKGLLDRSNLVRIHSVRALAATMGKDSEMFIDQMRRDGQRLVRAEAIRCYGKAGLATRVKELDHIATGDRDPLMRAAAVEAMGMLEDPSIPPLLPAKLRDPDFTVAAAAVGAIGTRAYRDAIPALMETYDTREDPAGIDVQLEAVRVLGEMGAVEAESLLVEAMSHDDSRVRQLAFDALTTMGRAPAPLPPARSFHEARFDRSRRKVLAPPTGVRRAAIKTSHGDIEIELFGDDAIQTVATFVQLTEKGFYKGLTTHRVVPNFVVQGGDPRGDGAGDAGFTIRAENSQHRYDTGYIGIADAGLDTGSCQWFITLSPQPRLDGRYTIFGRVTKGMDAAWKMDQGDTFEVRLLD